MAKKSSSPEYVKRHMKERIFQEKGRKIPAEEIVSASDGWQRWSFQERAIFLAKWMGMSKQQSVIYYLRPWFQLSLYVRKAVKRFFRVSFQSDHDLYALRHSQTKEMV